MSVLEQQRLSAGELDAVVARVAADATSWQNLVAHDRARRTYVELRRDPASSVWLICWSPGHDTGFHDHGDSAGSVQVVSGLIHEDRLTIGASPKRRELGPGGRFRFGPSDIHRVSCPGPQPAVTIHAYSPPLLAMGSYVVDDGGVLRRESIGGDEELVPRGRRAMPAR